MTDPKEPDAMTALREVQRRYVERADWLGNAIDDAIVALLAERARHGEEVAGLKEVRLSETRALDDLRLKEIRSLRDQLRRVEGERARFRDQLGECEAALYSERLQHDETRGYRQHAEQERDSRRKHYDAAGPEHNLLALLDLYHEREQRALGEVRRVEGALEGAATQGAMTASRLRCVAQRLRELSPGPNAGPMNAEEYLGHLESELTARRAVDADVRACAEVVLAHWHHCTDEDTAAARRLIAANFLKGE